jgi:hypothetical protein
MSWAGGWEDEGRGVNAHHERDGELLKTELVAVGATLVCDDCGSCQPMK